MVTTHGSPISVAIFRLSLIFVMWRIRLVLLTWRPGSVITGPPLPLVPCGRPRVNPTPCPVLGATAFFFTVLITWSLWPRISLGRSNSPLPRVMLLFHEEEITSLCFQVISRWLASVIRRLNVFRFGIKLFHSGTLFYPFSVQNSSFSTGSFHFGKYSLCW